MKRRSSSHKLEIEEEEKYVKQALKLGCLAIKFKNPGRRNAPDRINLGPVGLIFFIEFKRIGEKPRPGQVNYFNRLRKTGHEVFVCYTADEALEILKEKIREIKTS